MDAEQLKVLADNAELNHWPPHLGVTTDAEKIEYLAARLNEVVPIVEDQESQAFAFVEAEDARPAQVEFATKNPELVIETQDDIQTRIAAEHLYYNSGGRKFSGVSGFEAGWKAAKAYYEARQ